MSSWLQRLGCLALAGLFAPAVLSLRSAAAQTCSDYQLRVLTQNVGMMPGLASGRNSSEQYALAQAMGNALKESDPDVIVLQEVHEHTEWNVAGCTAAAVLCTSTGYCDMRGCFTINQSSKNGFINSLGGSYPYYVSFAGSNISLDASDYAQNDSGLMLFSKYPFASSVSGTRLTGIHYADAKNVIPSHAVSTLAANMLTCMVSGEWLNCSEEFLPLGYADETFSPVVKGSASGTAFTYSVPGNGMACAGSCAKSGGSHDVSFRIFNEPRTEFSSSSSVMENLADKGILLVRLAIPCGSGGATRYVTVGATHLEANSLDRYAGFGGTRNDADEVVAEDTGHRKTAMADIYYEIAEFQNNSTDAMNNNEEIYLLGDFNINGNIDCECEADPRNIVSSKLAPVPDMSCKTCGTIGEWYYHFEPPPGAPNYKSTPYREANGKLYDAWLENSYPTPGAYRDIGQTGGGPFADNLSDVFVSGYDADWDTNRKKGERLDYLIANHAAHIGKNGPAACVTHIRRNWKPMNKMGFDHVGVIADINAVPAAGSYGGSCKPRNAPEPTLVTPSDIKKEPPFIEVSGKMTRRGETQWYRINYTGTFSVKNNYSDVGYKIYLATDLGSAVHAYDLNQTEYGTQFRIAMPFYLAVTVKPGVTPPQDGGYPYTIKLTKHTCLSKDLACIRMPFEREWDQTPSSSSSNYNCDPLYYKVKLGATSAGTDPGKAVFMVNGNNGKFLLKILSSSGTDLGLSRATTSYKYSDGTTEYNWQSPSTPTAFAPGFYFLKVEPNADCPADNKIYNSEWRTNFQRVCMKSLKIVNKNDASGEDEIYWKYWADSLWTDLDTNYAASESGGLTAFPNQHAKEGKSYNWRPVDLVYDVGVGKKYELILAEQDQGTSSTYDILKAYQGDPGFAKTCWSNDKRFSIDVSGAFPIADFSAKRNLMLQPVYGSTDHWACKDSGGWGYGFSYKENATALRDCSDPDGEGYTINVKHWCSYDTYYEVTYNVTHAALPEPSDADTCKSCQESGLE